MDSSLRKSTGSADSHERWLVDALTGRRVVVTRSGAPGEALVNRLTELGAIVLHSPAISFAPPSNVALLREAVVKIAQYDWVVFTSANAVQAVSDQLLDVHGHLNVSLPAIATVGQATAAAVSALGWTVHFIAARGGGLALATELPVSIGAKILLPRADIASADLPNVLRDRECEVHEVIAYRTLANQSISLPAELRHADALMFTSPSTVAAFVSAANAVGWNLNVDQQAKHMIIACIGETTAMAVQEHNLAADVIATEQSAEGLIDALARGFHHRPNHAAP